MEVEARGYPTARWRGSARSVRSPRESRARATARRRRRSTSAARSSRRRARSGRRGARRRPRCRRSPRAGRCRRRAGRSTTVWTPVDVSLWGQQYASTSAFARATGCVPAGDSITSGSSEVRRGGGDRRRTSPLNSPKLRCWLRRSTSPNAAASQKVVEPPLPRRTSYPSGRANRSRSPSRVRRTTDRTPSRRWLVPR